MKRIISGLLLLIVFLLFFQSNTQGQALPSGWSHADIGSVGLAGSATFSNGTFTVGGSGTSIGSTADQMHFVYQPLSGDGTLVARIASVTGGTYPQAAVMIRETLNANAATVDAQSYAGSIYIQDRASTGANSSQLSSISAGLPYWAKIVRSGNSFSSYASQDGVNWVQVGTSQTITMATGVYVGLAVSSDNNSSLATATFDNVSLNSTTAPAPVISSLSATTASVGSQVTITGSGFGNPQGNSKVYLNTLTPTIQAWSATSIKFTVPTGATTGLVVVSVAPSMNDSNPVQFEVTTQPLPSSWLNQDVGAVGIAGTATYSNGTFTVKGSGTSLGSSTDQMQFVYQPLTGDGTLIARITSLSGGTYPQAAVMIRETMNANSATAYTESYAGNIYSVYRATDGGISNQTASTYVALPTWVKVVRSGSTFSSYQSSDGANWGQLGTSQTVTMATNAYIGLALSSDTNTSLATATFDNVSITSSASTPPVITSLSATTGTIGAQVVVNGLNFGTTQGNSQILLNGSVVTVDYWSSSAITITIPTGATSGPIVVSAAPTMNNSNPANFTITTQPLPSFWLNQDVGQVGLTGSATFANGAFTINGAGRGISNTASDSMQFVYRALSGDGSIVARVANLQGGGGYYQAGVVIRETLDPASTSAFICYQPNTATMYYRTSSGTNGLYQSAGLATSPYPYWMKLTRSGSLFSGYVSSDGSNWTQIGTSQTITMAANVYIGMAVDSQSTTAIQTAIFDNVSVNSATVPAPVISGLSATTGSIGSTITISGSNFGSPQGNSLVTLNGSPVTINSWAGNSIGIRIPSGATSGLLVVSVAPSMNDSNPVEFEVTTQPVPYPWKNADVGPVGITGSATFANGSFTINGAGRGISNTASDSMQFVYQALSGDGTIVARVVNLQGGGGYYQAGVVIRETLDPASTSAFICYQPNTATMYYRTSTGTSGVYQNAGFATSPYPYWMKLTRSGSSFSGYISSDGLNWTQIGTSQTITMAANVYIGMAVDSQSTTAIQPASFDNVSVNSATVPAPVISGLSATTGSIGSAITISGLNFGTTQGNSLVTLNGSPVTISSWAGNSIGITIPSGASTGLMVVSTAPSMNDSNPVVFSVTSMPLPSPWLDGDISSVPIAGSATYSAGTFTVNGSGTSIGGTADSFHFVYQPLSGDGTIVARVANIQPATNPQAGVMIRETLTAGASDMFVGYSPNQGYSLCRLTTGASSTFLGATLASSPFPYWTKITRTGNVITGFVSLDGVYWIPTGPGQTITMAASVYVGLAVSAASGSSLATVTFDNVSITTGTPLAAPVVSSVNPTVSGPGYSVALTGTGFGNTRGSSIIYFNSVPATAYGTWNSTQVSATVPSGVVSGPVSIVVNNLGSNRTVLLQMYTPTITSISPPSAEIGGTVVINGFGFTNGGGYCFVSFNGVTGTYANWSDSTITVPVPAGATTGPVTVSTYGIVSPGVNFAIATPPTITGISPTTGPAGSTVTINGSGFGLQQYNSGMTFNGLPPTSITSWSDTQIKVVVPVDAPSGPVLLSVAQTLVTGPTFTTTATNQITDSKGNVTPYTAVMEGGQWFPLQIQGSGCSSCTLRGNISFTYDVYGNALSKTDELGHVSTFTYDANSNLLTSTVPITSSTSATTTYTHNSFGEPLTVTDPLGNVTTNTYDGKGNLLTVTTPAPGGSASASVTQFAYDAKGELTTITDPLNHATTITYTAAGLINTITDAQSNVTTYGYDSHGNRTSVKDALNHTTTFAYDAGDRLKTITYPDTTTTTFAYDTRGRRTSVTDQNSKAATYAYDDADRLTSVTDAGNNVTTYAYDTENNLTSIKDANQNTTSFTYDQFGRVTQTNFPATHVEMYGYDAVGNLTSQTDRKNQQITYTYDQLNRLTQKTYPNSTTVNYTYDNDSRLTQVTDPSGTYSFTFDNMGRLTNTTTSYAFLTGRNFATAYGYDAASNRTGFTDPESGATAYVYDTLNRLQTLTEPTAFGGGNFGFTYDALSRRIGLTRPNAVNTAYSYDNLSRLLGVTHAKSGTTLDGANYTVDNAGNRSSRTSLPGTTTTNFTYDNIYELLTAKQGSTTKESYTYDLVGNRLSNLAGSGWSNNSSNELTSRPGVSYTYDNDGNTLTKADSSGTSTYTWDFENRLTSVVLPGTGGTVSFKYDPFGRRIYKSSSSGTSAYAYDGVNLVEETNASGGAVARYSQDLGVDEPLAMLRSGATSFYHVDGNDNVTSLSNAAGSLAQTYTFDSFGNVTASSGTLTNPFQYTAREWDAETRLQFSRFRYFDPGAGRFISEDPIQFYGGTNFYAYTHNRPTYYVDAFGLQEGWNDYKNVGNVFTLIRARGFANEALDGAENWARQHQLPPGALHNGPADAFRHCFWSCTMTRYLGEAVAETIADEHEKQNNRDGQPKPEELMDRANNLAGRTAALNCPKNDKSCWDLCTDLYNRGRLFGLGGRPNYFPQQ